MIKGISEHLFAVLRDVIYVSDEISHNPKFDLVPRQASPTRCSTSCATPASCIR